MKKILTPAFFIIICLGTISLLVRYAATHNVAVLNPQGIIAHKEFSLLVTATLLMLIVVIPVFILTFVIAWKYRAGNTKAKYMPNWDHHHGLEFTWWAIPCALIFALSILNWNSSHDLDPYKALVSNKQPIQVEVVALDWKWLFIYPQQNIASVNFLQFPVDTPVNYTITSDAPMNSFWIPSLGGQVYAMSGMTTQLHLMANKIGDFEGSSANISGTGFAGMRFVARASSQADFDSWVAMVKGQDTPLNTTDYKNLAKPSENNPASYYSSVQSNLFDDILLKYMAPGSTVHNGSMAGMSM